MDGTPIVNLQISFTAASATATNPYLFEATSIPLDYVPMRWALQVTGLDASNALQTPTAWDVILQGSLDNINWNDMTTPIIEHKNVTNAIGDVVFGGGNYYPVRFIKIHVKTYTKNVDTHILVSLLGVS